MAFSGRTGRLYCPGCAEATELRLYVGATLDDPVDGMFSFFPCQKYRPGSSGFARPRIRLPGIVNPACLMGNPLNRGTAPERFPSLWQQVREQVVRQGCELGVRAGFPERR